MRLTGRLSSIYRLTRSAKDKLQREQTEKWHPGALMSYSLYGHRRKKHYAGRRLPSRHLLVLGYTSRGTNGMSRSLSALCGRLRKRSGRVARLTSTRLPPTQITCTAFSIITRSSDVNDSNNIYELVVIQSQQYRKLDTKRPRVSAPQFYFEHHIATQPCHFRDNGIFVDCNLPRRLLPLSIP